MSLRRSVYNLISDEIDAKLFARRFNFLVFVVIVINTAALMLETVQSIRAEYGLVLHYIEVISVAFFSVEYVLRVWTSPESGVSTLKYWTSPLAVVDLLAILPFYLPMLGIDLRFARSVRLFRFVRVAKLLRYSAAITDISSVIRSRKHELLLALAFVSILVIFSGSLIYFVEHDAQPAVFSSIPQSAWWAVTTLTTVGYGDAYPITPLGKVLTSFIAICGIGLFAVPTSILGAAFVERFQRKRAETGAFELNITLDLDCTRLVQATAVKMNISPEEVVRRSIMLAPEHLQFPVLKETQD